MEANHRKERCGGSRGFLEQSPAGLSANPVVIVIADGLSAIAAERHASPLLEALAAHAAEIDAAPVVIVEQARVAIGDEIGELLKAQMTLLLIGERPGLSSPDSLGAYITWHPRPGRTDAERNCISNIRAEGLSYLEAAGQLASCLAEARRRRLTGVALKMESHFLPKG